MKFALARFLVFPFSRFLVFLVAAILLLPHASAQIVKIPDPNLEQAIREELGLSSELPIAQQEMLRLSRLHSQEGRAIAYEFLEERSQNRS